MTNVREAWPSLLLALASACFDPDDTAPVSEGSGTQGTTTHGGTTETSSGATITVGGTSTGGSTTNDATSSSGCPAAVYDGSNYNEVCYQ